MSFLNQDGISRLMEVFNGSNPISLGVALTLEWEPYIVGDTLKLGA